MGRNSICRPLRSVRRHSGCSRVEPGFSLVELLITLAVFGLVTGGLILMFDSSGRVARVQTQVAVMQQGQRVGHAELVRYIKQAGRGGLPITRLNLNDGDTNGIADALEGTPDYDLIGAFPRGGYAVSIINNVQQTLDIVDLNAGCDPELSDNCILPGSDVLIVRGVFSTPVYYIEPPVDITTWLAGIDTGALSCLPGTDPKPARCLTIPGRVRIAGNYLQDYPQDLEPLTEKLKQAKDRADATQRPEALILRDTSNPNAYVVMEFDHVNITSANVKQVECPDDITGLTPPDPAIPNCLIFPLRLDNSAEPGTSYFDSTTGTNLGGQQGQLLGMSNDATPVPVRMPDQIGSVGLLEEYRFFVRVKYERMPNWWFEEYGVNYRLRPVLARARFLPTTNNAIANDTSIMVDQVVDIADGVIDLQIAVGADTDDLGSGAGYGQILEDDPPSDDDELLFNSGGGAPDDPGAGGAYAAPPNGKLAWFNPDLDFHFLRVNTLVEAAEPDLGYQAPLLTGIEDYDRGATFNINNNQDVDPVDYNDETRRRYRRRWLRSIVELRNL